MTRLGRWEEGLFLSKLSPVPLSGAVPDGASLPGTMLTLEKGGAGNVTLRWGPSCRPSDNVYAVYEGTLGSFTSHVPRNCNVFDPFLSLAPGAGNRYYLVVPTDTAIEGSYGRDGNGNERPPSTAGCYPQSVGSCAP